MSSKFIKINVCSAVKIRSLEAPLEQPLKLLVSCIVQFHHIGPSKLWSRTTRLTGCHGAHTISQARASSRAGYRRLFSLALGSGFTVDCD